MPIPRRVAIFASVSTPAQATTDKDSLPSQLRDGQAWTEATDGQVVATYRVPGHSRKYIFFQDAEAEIPAYRQLRADCEARTFDVLWCRARDRLGRTDALIAQVEALVANAGAEVYSATMPHALGTSSEASAIFLSSIERASAQVENVVRAQRHRVGIAARVRRGLHPNNWPYGYRVIRSDHGKVIGAEFVPERVAAVRLITDLYLRGYGYRSIVQVLETTPYRPQFVERWSAGSVAHILANDTYAGYITSGGLRSEQPSELFPAVWDEATYRAVVQERSRRYRGRNPPATCLSGILICARCGHRMTADKRNRIFYTCASHRHHRTTGVACHRNRINADEVFPVLRDFLLALSDPDALSAALDTDASPAPGLQAERGQLQASIQGIQKKRERLALALASSIMLPDAYRGADDHLVADLEALAHQLSEVDLQLASLPDPAERRANFEAIVSSVAADPQWLRNVDPSEGRSLLQRAGLSIYVEEGQIVSIGLD